MKSIIANMSIALLLSQSNVSEVGALKSAKRGDKENMIRISRHEKDGGVSKGYFHYGVTNIPHDDKKEKGGEDAYLASNNFMMVADGIGGWSRQGVDSGIFSKTLVAQCKTIFDFEPAHELR